MKKLLARAGHALRVVVHDPNVDRAGKSLAVVVAIRLLLAFGASAGLVEVLKPIIGQAVGQ